MHGCVGEEVDELRDNAVAGQFDVEHVFAAVNFLERNLLAVLVGLVHRRADVVHEAACEGTVENLLFMFDKSVHALAFQCADDRRAQVNDLLVDVGYLLENLVGTGLTLLRDEREKQLLCLLGREQTQFVSILDVHDFVADIVGRLDQIHQRMAQALRRTVGGLQSQLRCNASVGVFLLLKKSELRFLAALNGGPGILDNGGERRIGHDEAARTTSLEGVGEQAEGIGIAVEVSHVGPFFVVHQRLVLQSVTFFEIGGDGPFAAVSERRISHVVGKAGGTDDASDFAQVCVGQFGMLFKQEPGHVVAEAASHASHLERVGQAVVDKHAAGQREHLRLVLQSPEGCRENQPVVVALKLRSVVFMVQVQTLLPQPFIRK